MSCAPGRAKRRLYSAFAVVGLCLVAALALRVETASHGEVMQSMDGEWMIVPDLLGDGFWLIDDKGRKQPIYHTHRRFLRRAADYVAGFKRAHGRVPTAAEYRRQAVTWLANAAR